MKPSAFIVNSSRGALIDKTAAGFDSGWQYKEIAGTPAEQEELEKSYEHLCKLRDEVIEMGIIPAIKDWHALNPNID